MIKATAATKSKTDEAREYAEERRIAITEADTAFHADVAKAAEKRDKVYADYPDKSNLAEMAWNATKTDDDPLYKDVVGDFRRKLDFAAETVRATGNADIAGLEAFEAEIKRLLTDLDIPTGTALVPAAATEVAAEDAADTAAGKSSKKGK
jgi:hypothetical protein